MWRTIRAVRNGCLRTRRTITRGGRRCRNAEVRGSRFEVRGVSMLHTRRFCVALGFIWSSLWMGTDALAQGNEAVDHAQRANSLSGIVVDMAGAPVTGVARSEETRPKTGHRS